MSKPNARWRRLALVVLFATAAPVSGCAAPAAAEPTGGLAVIVGAHANMPPAAMSGIAGQVVTNAVATRSAVSLVVADGAPFVAEDGRLAGLDRHDSGSNARREVVEDAISRAVALTPETDLLAALRLAAEQVADAPGRHTILVVDSGLSTSGALSFRQDGMLAADAADVVASLEAADALPDLSGVHVVFHGLGDTAAPQPALGAVVREQLTELWTAVALRAGALDVNVERTALAGDAPPGLPPVSVVGSGGGVSCTENSVVLTGGDVAFVADSAVFQDAVNASETLQPIADSIKAAAVTARLTGTTANVGDAEGQRRLSEQRAQAVGSLLIGLGVPPERLTVVGLGSEFPGYVPDRDSAGNLLPGAAAQNRKVTIELSGAGASVICG